MLTRALAIVTCEEGRAVPDRLPVADERVRRFLDACVELYRGGVGRERGALHAAVEDIVPPELGAAAPVAAAPGGPPPAGDVAVSAHAAGGGGREGCPRTLALRRARALCKLLDDAARWDTGSDGRAARQRLQLFSMAAHHHPLRDGAAAGGAGEHGQGARGPEGPGGGPGAVGGVGRGEGASVGSTPAVRERLAARLGTDREALERSLYRDVPDRNRLLGLAPHRNGDWLAARYDVAQVQAALFGAERATVHATRQWKAILRAVKLARLLHEIRREGSDAYRIVLTGPATPLRRTSWYGARLARLVPTLVTCDGWCLVARVRTPGGARGTLRVGAADGLRADRPRPPDYDSGVEAAFADAFGERRAGWRLVREGVVLHDHQTVFFPDFTFRHDDGTEVHLEIVGFWTDDYLERKRRTLRRFAREQVVVAIPERSAGRFVRPGDDVILYRTRLRPEPVIAALEARRPP